MSCMVLLTVYVSSTVNKIVGYARVSTGGQNTDTQVASLKEAGCEVVFEESISVGRKKRTDPIASSTGNAEKW